MRVFNPKSTHDFKKISYIEYSATKPASFSHKTRMILKRSHISNIQLVWGQDFKLENLDSADLKESVSFFPSNRETTRRPDRPEAEGEGL